MGRGSTIGDILQAKAEQGDPQAKAVYEQVTKLQEARLSDARKLVTGVMACLAHGETSTHELVRNVTLVISKSHVEMKDPKKPWKWEVSTKPMPVTAVQAEWILMRIRVMT